jgi:ribosomal peptide maturation radical SAM protein 1
MPRIAEAGYDLRMHYEIKANMRRDQLQVLLAAGVTHVQPGIESLSSRVLKLMDKGVTGCQNIRVLRDTESLGMKVSWNYLCGFPGEDQADYDSVLRQFPALHHLSPPGSAEKILVERFSPYFDRPELGFSDIRPASHYRVIFDLPDAELTDLAYLFTAGPQGVSADVLARLRAAATEWQHAYHERSRLTCCDLGSEIVLVSARPGFDWHAMSLTSPAEVAVFRLLDQPHSAPGLLRKLPPAADGGLTETELAGLLRRWVALGLVFTENGQYIHVASSATNQELQRIGSGRQVLAHA